MSQSERLRWQMGLVPDGPRGARVSTGPSIAAVRTMTNLAVIVTLLLCGGLLMHPRLRRLPSWHATVTPLASIIGSGFLVLAPLLVRDFGTQAGWVMAGLCLFAYCIGGAIRFNILSLDDRAHDHGGVPAWGEWVSGWALGVAYVISVCYYLNLFGAFAVSMTPWAGELAGRVVTSAILLLIAVIGWFSGLSGMEKAEQGSVTFKLAVIVALVVGMALFALIRDDGVRVTHHKGPLNWHSLAVMFGLIITVQGFETSRYLGEKYDAITRVRTMRYAQWMASAIYIAYIGLASMLFPADAVPLKETAVIDMMAPIASLLPALLVAAALAAQFSAAVADTNGCGGLVQEMSHGKIRSRHAYLGLVVLALLLTWSANIFQIISYASRAFAFYYFLQCALAAQLSLRKRQRWHLAGFSLLSLVLLAATVLGIPAE